MPQFMHHDFFLNFTASIKAGDLDLTNDILANELSDFIVFDTEKIIKALNKADIKIDQSSTDENIVDSVIKNISANKKLPKAIAYIIAQGNELLTGPEEKQLQTIATISSGLEKMSAEITKNPIPFKTSTMDQVVSKATKRTEYKRIIWNKDKKGISGGLFLLIGGAAIALVVVVIYYRQRSAVTNAIPQMINGGPIDIIQAPAIPVAPIVPAVPVAPIALLPEPIITQPI